MDQRYTQFFLERGAADAPARCCRFSFPILVGAAELVASRNEPPPPGCTAAWAPLPLRSGGRVEHATDAVLDRSEEESEEHGDGTYSWTFTEPDAAHPNGMEVHTLVYLPWMVHDGDYYDLVRIISTLKTEQDLRGVAWPSRGVSPAARAAAPCSCGGVAVVVGSELAARAGIDAAGPWCPHFLPHHVVQVRALVGVP